MQNKGLLRLVIICIIIFVTIIFLVRVPAPSAKAEISMLPITDSEASLIEFEVLSLQGTNPPQNSNVNTVSNVSANQKTITLYNHLTKKTASLPMEDYLTGVVAAEMPALFEPEALKAQAVAARTYLTRRIAKGKCGRGDADICSDSKHCQAWLSDGQLRNLWGEGYNQYITKIKNAVSSTAGQVIYYNDEPINALYHSVSGGQTEDCAAVFQQSLPYLVSVSSPGEEDDSNYKSQVTYTPSKLVSTLNKAFPKAKLTTANLSQQLKILFHTTSGRVDTLKIGKTTAEATEVRLALGLKSTDFTISFSASQVVFNVTGYGHGVGMSQRGADVMAQKGSTYKEILLHYYSNTVIK